MRLPWPWAAGRRGVSAEDQPGPEMGPAGRATEEDAKWETAPRRLHPLWLMSFCSSVKNNPENNKTTGKKSF
jgi:hypothetical protein